MKALSVDDIERLRRWIEYCPSTGRFWWKARAEEDFSDQGRYGASPASRIANCRKWNASWAGRECFMSDNGRGYRIGVVGGENFQAHRLAWAIYYGVWPEGHIDHINRERHDNRIGNLRLASPSQNQANKPSKSGGWSLFKGVTYHVRRGRWTASIREGGVQKHLGYFDVEAEAAEAYRLAAERVHGEFSTCSVSPDPLGADECRQQDRR